MQSGLLIDINPLVLYVVGSVNPEGIETFKPTSQYLRTDFDLLKRVVQNARQLYSVPHVFAEVSNLTDLKDRERQAAREVLKDNIRIIQEVVIGSLEGCEDSAFVDLGLTDAVIAIAARRTNLYLLLSRTGVEVYDFVYLRAAEYGS